MPHETSNEWGVTIFQIIYVVHCQRHVTLCYQPNGTVHLVTIYHLLVSVYHLLIFLHTIIYGFVQTLEQAKNEYKSYSVHT